MYIYSFHLIIHLERHTIQHSMKSEGDIPKVQLVKDSLFIKKDSKYYAVKYSSILWIYAKGHHCTFYTNEGQEYIARISLTNLLQYLSHNNFIQCHRNYIVNLSGIDAYDPNGFVEIGSVKIPVGCLLYTSPSPRDRTRSRMPSSA